MILDFPFLFSPCELGCSVPLESDPEVPMAFYSSQFSFIPVAMGTVLFRDYGWFNLVQCELNGDG